MVAFTQAADTNNLPEIKKKKYAGTSFFKRRKNQEPFCKIKRRVRRRPPVEAGRRRTLGPTKADEGEER